MEKIKLLVCTAVLMLAGAGSSALYACGYCYALPEDYYVYRISDNYLKKAEVDPAYLPGSKENCQLWMQQLKAETIGPEEVYDIVYKAELDSIASLAEYNAFATILLNNPEALKVLRLAKDCEQARFRVTGDPWYYPVYDDSEHRNLEKILVRARDCTSELFRSRYFLQEVRALFTLGRYEEIINRWEAMKDSLPDDILKELTVRYVAGAKYNLKDVDKAVEMFLSVGDLTSAIGCMELWEKSELEAVIEIDVNYKGMRKLLEDQVRAICYNDNISKEVQLERLAEIRGDCDAALAKNPADKAVWYYTAAYIEYFKDNFSAAKKLLKKARKSLRDDEVLEGSVKVLDILIDARASRHNFFYERRLMKDLKWLDAQIVDNLTDEVREQTAGDTGWMMRANFSYYYWNDMMRVLTLGILAPDYLKAGKETKALQLANMADNRLLSLTGVDEYEYSDGNFNILQGVPYKEHLLKAESWKPVYSNSFFEMADTLSARKFAAYVKRATGPKNEFDRFTAERGYVDKDYLNDIAGTKYIRERSYADALKYIGQLPEGFQERLNTKEYLNNYTASAKLDYIHMMLDLEEEMRSSDPETAAQAKFTYGRELMMQYRMNWALSYYSWSAYPSEYVERTNEEGMGLAEKLIVEGMETMPDKESAAYMQYEMSNFKTAAEKYPGTEAAGWVLANCDVLEDYHGENPVHWDIQ